MKKVLTVLLAAVMSMSVAFSVSAEPAAVEESHADYTQYREFEGTYGFGDAEVTAYTDEDMTIFRIEFISFDEQQVLEGTVDDGVVTVTYDKTGFMAGDAQKIWDDAVAVEEDWNELLLYSQVEEFDGSYGFGDAEVTAYTDEDMSIFRIEFVSFDEQQVIEGTVEDGIVTVTNDKTGFMAGDAQKIWDDAVAADNWTTVEMEDIIFSDDESLNDSADAEEQDWPEKVDERNGYKQYWFDTQLTVHDNWQNEIDSALEKYDTSRQNEIIFYGASNFARWTTLDDDLADYKVQNHAFGGSNDAELIYYANDLIYPYNPSIIFFQTGSNDYVQIMGADDEKVANCIKLKKEMFEAFHEQLPDAKFVIMSGLLLPNRSQYVDITNTINEELKKIADEYDYIYFVDASDMTYDGTAFAEELFVEDGIHLNSDGQHKWLEEYIRPALETIITENGMEYLKK